jgi:hypothetical protein
MAVMKFFFCKVLLNKGLMVQVRYKDGFLKIFLGTRPHPRPNPVWRVGEGARNTAVCLPVSSTLSVDAAWCLPASSILPADAVCLPRSSAHFLVAEVSLPVSSTLRAVSVCLPASLAPLFAAENAEVPPKNGSSRQFDPD